MATNGATRRAGGAEGDEWRPREPLHTDTPVDRLCGRREPACESFRMSGTASDRVVAPAWTSGDAPCAAADHNSEPMRVAQTVSTPAPGDARPYPWPEVRPNGTMDIVSATTPTPPRSRDIRVLVVDDHPAVRAALEGLLIGERGFECVATLAETDGLLDAVSQIRPDVVVLDYALGADDGLTTCFRVKQQDSPPAVVLYSAYVDRVFTVPAALAQADATVSKSAPVGELLSAIRDVASSGPRRPALDTELIEAASARLLTDDLPIAAMLLSATPVGDIATVVDTSVADVRSRALRIIGRLQAGNRRRPPRSATAMAAPPETIARDGFR
jgi:DNA-binding NarL/FixJ family response regulator